VRIGGDAHADGIRPHVQAKAAMQPVPQADAARPVGIGGIATCHVMDPVHARCGQEQRQPPLPPARQANIGVMKQHAEEKEPVPNVVGPRIRAQQDDHRHAHRRRYRLVHRVKSDGRRHVEVQIDMVDPVESPQRRINMRPAVPPVHRPVERQKPRERTEAGSEEAHGAKAAGIARQKRGERVILHGASDKKAAGTQDDIVQLAAGARLSRHTQRFTILPPQ
tara:strand:+ start:57829 stop:58494 length:666 start_codon:yes stop_codon:yes gene_type:complete